MDPQQDPQIPVVLLQICDTVSIRHVMQHLFGRSELLSGHTNGAQMRGAISLASARHFEKQAYPMLAPAVGVAIWEHFEDALEADGAEEVPVGGLVLAIPA